MDFTSLLTADSVVIASDISSKKRLLQRLAEVAGQRLGVPSVQIFDALQERESLGATGVGGGIALPHARLDGIDRVHGVFMKLERGVDFEAVDKQPVDLVFALFAPENAGSEHLKALALVSRTLRDPGLCAKLRSNSDPGTLLALLISERGTKAA